MDKLILKKLMVMLNQNKKLLKLMFKAIETLRALRTLKALRTLIILGTIRTLRPLGIIRPTKTLTRFANKFK